MATQVGDPILRQSRLNFSSSLGSGMDNVGRYKFNPGGPGPQAAPGTNEATPLPTQPPTSAAKGTPMQVQDFTTMDADTVVVADPGNVSNNDMVRILMNMQKQFHELSLQVKNVHTDVLNIGISVKSMADDHAVTKSRVQTLENKLVYLEKEIRSNNIIVGGLIQDLAKETPNVTLMKVKFFFREDLQLHDIDVSNAYRINTVSSANKPIVVKLVREADKYTIFKAVNELKPQNIWVKPDRSKEVREVRGKLGPIRDRLVGDGHQVQMVEDFLLVDGVRYNYDPHLGDIKMQRKK